MKHITTSSLVGLSLQIAPKNTGTFTKPPHEFSKLWIWLYIGCLFPTQASRRAGRLQRPHVDSRSDKKMNHVHCLLSNYSDFPLLVLKEKKKINNRSVTTNLFFFYYGKVNFGLCKSPFEVTLYKYTNTKGWNAQFSTAQI